MNVGLEQREFSKHSTDHLLEFDSIDILNIKDE